MTKRAATPQLRAFTEGEGDRWFERNRQALVDPDAAGDPPLRLIEAYGLRPENVLEVGAANGYRLAALASALGCRVTGLEPSAAAVADGLARFPGVRLQIGGGNAIPFDESFDLVIVNFVLHWVDRSLLLRTVAEIDRVISDGGFLVIGDFLPSHPVRRPYHHLPGEGVFTYKQDYAAIFLASGCYQQIATLSGDHSSAALTPIVEDDNRSATWLLRKRLEGLYEDRG
jgi:SAM-dependent methyltransferase